MKRSRSTGPVCPVAAALEAVGEWWSLLVVREAFHGTRRFDELQARLGIARNILTRRLRSLVDHGVLERRRYQEHPPRFEYALTEKGRALYPVIVALFTWGSRWAQPTSPAALVEVATGRVIEPVLVDRLTGAPVDPGAMRIQRAPAAGPAGAGGGPAPTPRRARRRARSAGETV
jgi:DNA-binding HxlR family transcriptional regulator